MAQSTEFPELRFVEPDSWRSGRPSGQPTLVVIHDTEGSEGKQSAEDGASYDTRRTDGTSTHFFVDADSAIQCVLTKDTAHHAMPTGNARGIGFELCGKASQTFAQWKDGGLDLRLAAKYVAKCCEKWDIPAKKLTVAEVKAGKRGICGHVDITNAFHESTHTDPGPNFPWSEFMELIQAELEGNDMPTAKEIAQAVWNTDNIVSAPWPVRTPENPYWAPGTTLHHGLGHAIQANQKATELLTKVDGLITIITTLADALKAGGGDLDTAAVLAKLDGLVSQVNDLSAKLATAEAERDALQQRLADALAK